MKRFLVLILTILYITSTVGATVHLHFCMGHLISTSLFSRSSNLCVKCGMEKHSKKSGCCEDVKLTIKSDNKHLPSQLIYNSGYTFRSNLPRHNSFSEILLNADNSLQTIIRHKPPLLNCPIYISIQNFRV